MKISYTNRKSYGDQTKIFSNNSNLININENNFYMTVCGDLTIKIYDHQLLKEKKIGRIAFNTAFLGLNENSFTFTIDQIDPDSLQSDKKIHSDFEITVIIFLKFKVKLNKSCDCNNRVFPIKTCEVCNNYLKWQMDTWNEINLIVDVYLTITKIINH